MIQIIINGHYSMRLVRFLFSWSISNQRFSPRPNQQAPSLDEYNHFVDNCHSMNMLALMIEFGIEHEKASELIDIEPSIELDSHLPFFIENKIQKWIIRFWTKLVKLS